MSKSSWTPMRCKPHLYKKYGVWSAYPAFDGPPLSQRYLFMVTMYNFKAFDWAVSQNKRRKPK